MTFLGSALFGGPLKTELVAWNVVVDLLEATLDSPPKVLEFALLSSLRHVGHVLCLLS